MNSLGRLAMNHWRLHLPDQFATIDDPTTYFSELGLQAETQIADLASDLAGPDQAGEGYLTKLGRLNAARQRAREAVLPELILITPPTPSAEQVPTRS